MNLSPAAIRVFPFAIFVAFMVLASALEFLNAHDWIEFTSWDARWLYPAKAFLVLLALLLLWRRFGELSAFSAMRARDWAMAVAAGAVVFGLWISLNQDWASLGEAGGYSPVDPATGNIDWLLVAVRIFGAVLVVPLMEELFWRAFLMRWLERHEFLSVDPASVGLRVVVIAAVLFAIGHNLWVAGLIAGLAYGWLYVWSRNLWVPVVAHAVTNGLLAVWVVQTQQWDLW